MDEQMMAFLKEMRDEMNKRFDELQNEIKMTQQAVLDTSGEVKASINELEKRLDVHRQKFTFIEEELHILREKQ